MQIFAYSVISGASSVEDAFGKTAALAADGGKWTGGGEYSSSGGEAHDRRRMADAQQPAVFATTVHGKLSQAFDGAGGKTLSGSFCPGGSGGSKRTDRAQFAPGCTHNEEVLMREQTPCGEHLASFCPQTTTAILKSAMQLC